MVSNDQTTWNDCPPGALVRFSHRARQRRLLQLATQTTVAVTVVALLSFTAWFGHLHWGQRQYQYYGMTCADVRELLPAYQSGRLDARRSDVLVLHVNRCSICAELRPLLRSDDRVAAVVPPRDEPCQCCVYRSVAALQRAGDELGVAAHQWPSGQAICFMIQFETGHRPCRLSMHAASENRRTLDCVGWISAWRVTSTKLVE